MAYYLLDVQITPSLNAGKAIEQWLGVDKRQDYNVLKWIRIDKNKSLFDVTYFESFDDGDEIFLDIYSFSSVDADEPYGLTSAFPTLTEALQFASTHYGAKPDKYVLDGNIQQEYRAYLTTK